MGLAGEVDPIQVFELREFLAVPVGDDDGQGIIVPHHVLIRPGAAGNQYVLQRDAPALGDVPQRLPLACLGRDEVEQGAEGMDNISGHVLLSQQGRDLLDAGRLIQVVSVGDLAAGLLAPRLGLQTGKLG